MKTGESLVIDHIDEDKKNNRLSNLRLITHQENIQRGHDRKAHIISAHYLKQAQKWQSVKTIRGVQYRDTGLSRKEAIDKVKYLISVSKGK